MDMPRFRHSSASSTLFVKMTTEWCAAVLFRCFRVRLSGITCATCSFLLVFSSSISSLSMTSSSVMVGSRSFLGTPCTTSPYLRFLVLTPLNIRLQSILLSSWGSSFDSQWSLYSSFESLLMPWILGTCPSLELTAIVLWHFYIMSLACIDFNWFLVVSGAVAAVMVIVSFSRYCFFLLSFAVFALCLLVAVSGGFVRGSVATICANVGVGFDKSLLMSFRSFDICSVFWFLLSSSSFSRFSVMCLASSIMLLAFSMSFWLFPEHLVAVSSTIVSPSRVSNRMVLFGIAVFDLCSLGCCFSSGVSGITVPERGSAVIWGGVASMIGVLRGRIGERGTLIVGVDKR